jgi:CheY-like chemotaxis protein
VHQVLMNLAINARDAMPGGGALLIETRNVEVEDSFAEEQPEVKAGPYVRLRVSDNGTGMSKEVMSHLFEPFFTTKKVGEGTGLGLATVYGIVQQCCGSIRVASELGKGTTFEIYLPRIAVQEAAPEGRIASASPPRGTETILLVEDLDQLRRMVARVLRGRGYRVLEAAHAADALDQAGQHDGAIDLLLTDIVMPGLSGVDLAAQLKSSHTRMKVIFMSGYSERAAANHWALDSADAYLPKPLTPELLTLKIREVLDAAGGSVSEPAADSPITRLLRKLSEA